MTELAAVFNPFEPGFADDPYEQYGNVRATNPVHQSVFGAWILFGYDDVVKMLRDPSLSVEADKAEVVPNGLLRDPRDDVAESRSSRAMLNLDPPDHTRLRRLVSKAFTPRVIEGLRPRVQQLVDVALDEAREKGTADVIADLAFPLPFAVISEMLGLPDDRRNEVRGWSHAMVKTLDPIITEDELQAAITSAARMMEYVTEMVEWKRKQPADDLLSALVAVEDEGERLTTDELHDQVILLYIAGHETTVNLIGNGTLALLRNRDQLELLHDDPTLVVSGAVDELLRYDSPVQFSRRITLQDVELGGRHIPKGSFVLTGLGAANRDPAHWGEDAATLDLKREGAHQHVAFGGGVHHCLGAALARLEAQVAIGSVVSRFPKIELAADAVEWNGRVNLRGLASLPVALGV
jgi:cytochrome P450